VALFLSGKKIVRVGSITLYAMVLPSGVFISDSFQFQFSEPGATEGYNFIIFWEKAKGLMSNKMQSFLNIFIKIDN
jgi:hypothetical protein